MLTGGDGVDKSVVDSVWVAVICFHTSLSATSEQSRPDPVSLTHTDTKCYLSGHTDSLSFIHSRFSIPPSALCCSDCQPFERHCLSRATGQS